MTVTGLWVSWNSTVACTTGEEPPPANVVNVTVPAKVDLGEEAEAAEAEGEAAAEAPAEEAAAEAAAE